MTYMQVELDTVYSQAVVLVVIESVVSLIGMLSMIKLLDWACDTFRQTVNCFTTIQSHTIKSVCRKMKFIYANFNYLKEKEEFI